MSKCDRKIQKAYEQYFVSKKVTQPILDDINRYVVSVVHDHTDMVPHHIMMLY